MNERQIDCFLAVAQCGSFSAASRRLYLSQPAVTHQIRALEQELGVRLFRRDTVHTEMTPAAQAMLEDAQQLQALCQRIRSQMQTYAQPRRPLVLGCPEIMIEANQSALFEIARRATDLPEPITLDSRVALKPPQHVQQLLTGDVDLLICDLNQPELQLSSFARRHLFYSGVFIYLHRDHPLAARSRLRAQDLNGERVYWYADQTSFLESVRAHLCAHAQLNGESCKESFTQAVPFLRPRQGVTFYSCPLALDAPVVCRPFVLDEPIPIGLVWLRKHADERLLQLVELIAQMPASSWRNGE